MKCNRHKQKSEGKINVPILKREDLLILLTALSKFKMAHYSIDSDNLMNSCKRKFEIFHVQLENIQVTTHAIKVIMDIWRMSLYQLSLLFW